MKTDKDRKGLASKIAVFENQVELGKINSYTFYKKSEETIIKYEQPYIDRIKELEEAVKEINKIALDNHKLMAFDVLLKITNVTSKNIKQ